MKIKKTAREALVEYLSDLEEEYDEAWSDLYQGEGEGLKEELGYTLDHIQAIKKILKSTEG